MIAPKIGEPSVKKFLDKTYHCCEVHNLWCTTKHNVTNWDLLKSLQNNANKENKYNNNSPINDNNAVSFAAQMETILKE